MFEWEKINEDIYTEIDRSDQDVFANVHRTPAFRDGHLDRPLARGRDGNQRTAGFAVSASDAAVDPGAVFIPRRQRPGGDEHRRHAHRGQGQRRRRHALYGRQLRRRRQLQSDAFIRGRIRPRHGHGQGAEPRFAGRGEIADGSAAARRHYPRAVRRHARLHGA